HQYPTTLLKHRLQPCSISVQTRLLLIENDLDRKLVRRMHVEIVDEIGKREAGAVRRGIRELACRSLSKPPDRFRVANTSAKWLPMPAVNEGWMRAPYLESAVRSTRLPL